jgi:signal transduction histidine kinase
LHLIFWQQLPSGSVIGAELNRMRLLADILDELSEVETDFDTNRGTIILTDSGGRMLQRWGDEVEGPSTEVVVNLSAPLAAWTLSCSFRGEAATPASVTLARILGLLLATAGLSGLAIGLYRGSTRELREAALRVNFVNQVSHELRTPLTNIRLYAELLQDRLEDEDEKTQSHLSVIVAESHRLSRLIGNVLTFGRRQRGQLKLRSRIGSISETLTSAVERFRPTLLTKGITTDLNIENGPDFGFDPDAIEQIIGNLLNNVEKYGAAGGWVGVSLTYRGNEVLVSVEDHGPGIPCDRWDAVFEPFVRLKNELTEGVAGTGIGLSLSRDLARLHGGDLRLTTSEVGSKFELILPLREVST